MPADRRTRALSRVLLGVWCLLCLRAAQVQILQHARWQKEADRMRHAFIDIPARRGEIRSSDGQVLAQSVLNWSLVVDPRRVKNADALARSLDSLGLAQPQDFLRRLDEHKNKGFLWISRDLLSESRVDRLLQRYNSLTVQTEGKRVYPFGRAGGSVVGMVGQDEKPLGGLEDYFDDALRGRSGQLLRMSDAVDTTFQGFYTQVLKEAQPGANLEVTLHSRLQEIAAARLEAGVKREGAARGFCIITRPSTGEILALAAVPVLDPGDPATRNASTLKVCPVDDTFEPGSSYKLVTFTACIEAGLFDPDQPINCMNGIRLVPGGKIKDAHKYGVLKAWEVLAHSSNIGSGILAEKVGADRFYRMEKAYGFGLPTGIPLTGEGRGRIPEPDVPPWSQSRSLITEAFGQELSCTAIQMAMAYGAVANGGRLMRPLLVRNVRAADGTVRQRFDPEVVRTVMSPATATQLRGLFRRVVTDGTGEKAEIPGFEPAGKTSTAQKYIPEEGSYSTRKYIGSFVGFAPWQDPQILCLVLLDEPTSSIYGGSVAAPIFREVVSDAIPFLEGAAPEEVVSNAPPVPKEEQDPRREVPAVEGLSAALASRLLQEAGFLPRLQGDGDRVLACDPAQGELILPGAVVTLSIGRRRPAAPSGEGPVGDSVAVALMLPDSGSTPMPDLRGLCLRDALLRVRSVGGRAAVEGDGWVLTQIPAPGAPVAAGAACRVTLGPDSCRAYEEYLESERRASWATAAGDLLGESPR